MVIRDRLLHTRYTTSRLRRVHSGLHSVVGTCPVGLGRPLALLYDKGVSELYRVRKLVLQKQ